MDFDELFSQVLLRHRQIDSLQSPRETGPGPIRPTGLGHGPFCEFTDGSVKYDLSGFSLLGRGHPILIRSSLEGVLGLEERPSRFVENLLARTSFDYCRLTATPGEALELLRSVAEGEPLVLEFPQCALPQVLAEREVIAYEVEGAGRTPCLFAFEQAGLKEMVDAVVFGGGLQVSGALSNRPLPGRDPWFPPGALAAADRTLTWLCRSNLLGPFGRIAEIEERFRAGFAGLEGRLTLLSATGCAVYGEVPGALEFSRKLFEEGVVCGTFPSGEGEGLGVRFFPPLSLKNEHIEEIFVIVKRCLDSAAPGPPTSTTSTD